MYLRLGDRSYSAVEIEGAHRELEQQQFDRENKRIRQLKAEFAGKQQSLLRRLAAALVEAQRLRRENAQQRRQLEQFTAANAAFQSALRARRD